MWDLTATLSLPPPPVSYTFNSVFLLIIITFLQFSLTVFLTHLHLSHFVSHLPLIFSYLPYLHFSISYLNFFSFLSLFFLFLTYLHFSLPYLYFFSFLHIFIFLFLIFIFCFSVNFLPPSITYFPMSLSLICIWLKTILRSVYCTRSSVYSVH